MAEDDLPGNRDKADQTERPSRLVSRSRSRSGISSDAPGRRTRKRARRNSRRTATRNAACAAPARASNRSPPRHGPRCSRRDRPPCAIRNEPIGAKAHVLRASPQQQVQRHQEATSNRTPSQTSMRCAIPSCRSGPASHGRIVIEPTPTPEKAMLIASPRRRTNQFVRYSDCTL